jgi:hypothetical protein
LDIYDHYRFRYIIQKQGTQAFSGLEPDDKWQDKYFDSSNPASHDADVWFDAGDKGNVTPHDPKPAPARAQASNGTRGGTPKRGAGAQAAPTPAQGRKPSHHAGK